MVGWGRGLGQGGKSVPVLAPSPDLCSGFGAVGGHGKRLV